MPVPFEEIRRAATEVAERNGARCAILFGSYARGTALYKGGSGSGDKDRAGVGERDFTDDYSLSRGTLYASDPGTCERQA
jgi:hypothetical protein